MKTINVAVIGCGVIAPLHIENYLKCENTVVNYVCDIIEEKAKNAALKYNIPNYTTSADVIFNDPNIDAVSICTDHASHTALAIEAIKHGKAVLIEKCLTSSLEDLELLLKTAKENPSVITSGIFQHRFELFNQEIYKIVHEGLLGTMLTARAELYCERTNDYYKADAWRGTWKYEGGSILINQAIHFIDQLLWITDGPEDYNNISAFISNKTHKEVIETDDTSVAILPLKCGALGVIEATASSFEHWENTISLVGSHGTIIIHNEKPARISFKDKAIEEQVKARLEKIELSIAKQEKAYYGGGHTAQIHDFVDSVREKRSPFITLESAAITAKTILTIYDKFKNQILSK